MPPLNCYWWKTQPNFGDALGPVLLKKLAGIDVQWSLPADAEIICSGSTLDVLPQQGFTGVVVGSGKLHHATACDLTKATVVGLRGALTSRDVKYSGQPAFGCPGLLANRLVKAERDLIPLGLVAHVSDTDGALLRRFARDKPFMIDVRRDPLEVVAQIASCSKIITSSLHGLVVADSFGLPRQLEPFTHHNPWEGASIEGVPDFKFRDYASAFGERLQYGRMERGPVGIRKCQDRLERIFEALPQILEIRERKQRDHT